MLKIGLTGGIGTGKTTVANIFSDLGVPIYNSDLRAKKLMTSNKNLGKSITQSFGNESFKDGYLNKNYLSELVFNSKESLYKLNSIVHPFVAEDFKSWVADQDAKYIIKEAAILIESGAYKQMDKTILVTCSLSIRIKRVLARDRSLEGDVLKRINNQMNEKEKIKYSDYTIENDLSVLDLKNKVEILHSKLLLASKI